MYLSDIKIVDLRFSKWDKEKSNPKDGKYDFDKKAYVDMYGTKETRPPWFFTWCRYDPRNNYMEFRDWKISGYSAVQFDEDKYWPEPLSPNENGHYVFGDVIAVKRPLIDELKYRIEKQRRSTSAKSKIAAFQEKMASDGAGIPDSMLRDLLGS